MIELARAIKELQWFDSSPLLRGISLENLVELPNDYCLMCSDLTYNIVSPTSIKAKPTI